MNDEFYIGYRKTAPPTLARYVFTASVAIVVGVTAAALAIGGAQSPAGNGHYDFGAVETFEGPVRAEPFLHVLIGAAAGEDPAAARAALLVDQGKHGPPDYVRDAVDKRVRLRAAQIERHGTLMLEIDDPSAFEIVDDAPPAPIATAVPAPTVTLTGEIVDTKCYLGVMNPGRGKVHRGCAAECLRGGVPPGLLVRDANGDAHVIVLQPLDATAPEIAPDWAARTVVAEGSIHRLRSLSVLTYRRIALADTP